MAKFKRLKELGYTVIFVWEHNFLEFLKSDPELAKKIEKHPFVDYSTLDARTGIFGGRVECSKLFYECKDQEKMYLYDFCSLYPSVMKSGKYMLRHPVRIRMQKECESITMKDLMHIDGLVELNILPPNNLFWPVLPYRMHGKNIFLLCRTCAEENNINQCNHKDEERAIRGVYSLCEIKKAFEMGYKLIKVYELWEYETESGSDSNDKNKHENLNITYAQLMKKLKENEKLKEKKRRSI